MGDALAAAWSLAGEDLGAFCEFLILILDYAELCTYSIALAASHVEGLAFRGAWVAHQDQCSDCSLSVSNVVTADGDISLPLLEILGGCGFVAGKPSELVPHMTSAMM